MPQEAYEMLQNGDAVLIDVREPDEFKEEHIAYAISIPLSSFEQDLIQLDIPESKAILFQCLKGKRGEMACMRVQGIEKFKNPILNITGGIGQWKDDGLPVVGKASSSPKLSIARQVQMIIGGAVFLSALIGGPAVYISAILGAALFLAGLVGWCPLALTLSKMPWNK